MITIKANFDIVSIFFFIVTIYINVFLRIIVNGIFAKTRQNVKIKFSVFAGNEIFLN